MLPKILVLGKDCGGWGRTRYALNVKNNNVLGNAVQ